MLGFLSYSLNLDLSRFGVPKDALGSIWDLVLYYHWFLIPKMALGSVMITNVGSLGLEEAYVPLVPYSRVPLLLALGKVKDEAVVV